MIIKRIRKLISMVLLFSLTLVFSFTAIAAGHPVLIFQSKNIFTADCKSLKIALDYYASSDSDLIITVGDMCIYEAIYIPSNPYSRSVTIKGNNPEKAA